MKEVYVIIHGHFYQPPRFNPWTDGYDEEPSAAPYKNWNARISRECYGPNGYSRVLDRYGRILEIINNYRYMSFNFGPTLLSWMEENDSDAYKSIIAAEWASQQRSPGNGAAVAQAFNHMMMPLANGRDRQTQVAWGIEDFRTRFGRPPEGMWMPETGINNETVNVLIESEIRFTVLSPIQAARTRPLEETGAGGEWKDVTDGSIDTGLAYRAYYTNIDGSRDQGRHLDIFFFNKSISTQLSFEHLLRNSDDLARRILEDGKKCENDPSLVVLATDGELYGHHEPFGDMCLSYLFTRKARRRGLVITNFSKFLEAHPPRFEVELVEGDDGAGTSWSCAHGVDRWRLDCGCSNGGESGWRQKWRLPLREAFDFLRDTCAVVFEQAASSLGIRDPWAARDDYIRILLDGPEGRRADDFFGKHLTRTLKPGEKKKIFALFEAQRFLMMMYTSCAWFFSDVSGIESKIVIRFAARSLDLMSEFLPAGVEEEFTGKLASARSNKPGVSARSIYLGIKEVGGLLPEEPVEIEPEPPSAPVLRRMNEALLEIMQKIETAGSKELCEEAVAIIDQMDYEAGNGYVDRFHPENVMFRIIRKEVAPAVRRILAGEESLNPEELKSLILLAERLNFNMEKYRKRLSGTGIL